MKGTACVKFLKEEYFGSDKKQKCKRVWLDGKRYSRMDEFREKVWRPMMTDGVSTLL